MGHVLLDFVGLFQEIHGQDLAAKVPLVERPLQHGFIKVLELRERELGRQQLKTDRLVTHLALETLQRHAEYLAMVEGQRRQVKLRQTRRRRAVGRRLDAMIADVHQSVVGDGYDSLARVAVHLAEGVELLQKHFRPAPPPLANFAPGGLSSVSFTRTNPPGKAHLPANGSRSALDQKNFQIFFVQPKNNAVDR